jgi:hypothetical protein
LKTPKTQSKTESLAEKPRSRRFGFWRVTYFDHPTFGPEVQLAELGLEWKNVVSFFQYPKRVAKSLRQIADWLEGL